MSEVNDHHDYNDPSRDYYYEGMDEDLLSY